MSISEYCDRFNIKSRSTLYTRINGLKAKGINTDLITKDGKSCIPEALQQELDSLHQHLKSGNNIGSYQPLSKVEVLPPENRTAQYNRAGQLHSTTEQQYFLVTPELIQELAIAVTKNLKPLDPFWHVDRLRMLARFNIEITTKELRSLIGIKPKGERFNRGSFEFVKVGKIGSQSAWKVLHQQRKITE